MADPATQADSGLTPRATANIGRAAFYALTASIVAVLASFGALGAVVVLRPDVQSIQAGTTPASVASRQRAAVIVFNTCAKGDSAVDPDKIEDFHRACKDYKTLDDAYRAVGVQPPKEHP